MQQQGQPSAAPFCLAFPWQPFRQIALRRTQAYQRWWRQNAEAKQFSPVISTLALSRASSSPHCTCTCKHQGAQSQVSVSARSQAHDLPGCEHPFSSSRSGMAEVKKWNRDSSSQRQRKLNSTRHKHCQFLSEDCLQNQQENCHKSSDWKSPFLCTWPLLQPTWLPCCLKHWITLCVLSCSQPFNFHAPPFCHQPI